jgi:uncharacterized protein (DUF1697 family)
MNKNRFIALLRGINVGGNNIIKMADLKKSFETMGFSDVQTYIASGNVLFSADSDDKAQLELLIEAALSKAFKYASRVVVVSAKEMAQVVAQAPKGFGASPDEYRCDVLFVKAPTTTAEVLAQVSLKPGVDEVYAGEHAVYFQRLDSRASQSHINKIVQRPVYQSITIRNWNTTIKLLSLASV